MTLEPDHSLEDVAEAIGMSTRWLRDRIKEGAECIQYGNKFKFTTAQVDALRAQYTKAPSA